MEYFNEDQTLFEITETYPETVPVFASNGFSQMEDEQKRADFGKKITLKLALMLKQHDVGQFSQLLIESIEQKRNQVDLTLSEPKKAKEGDALNIVGLLPCPVRLPLLEQFNQFIDNYEKDSDVAVNHELKAASMGLDWVANNLEGISDAGQLPDLFISAGFDMFFDEQKIGRFKEQGVFTDASGLDKFNDTFSEIDLKDPRGHYSMISVVPAVFLINTSELGDLPVPKSWDDILKPEFEKRVSLPVGDFDLFNGILLNIHKKYGDEGVAKLGRSLLESLHPSQMVKSERKKENRPIVTIMPYFFTKMVKEGSMMQAVWPEDGAIISPIFMLSKKEKLKQLQPIIEFFASRGVGEVLAHQGLFPSAHHEVDNKIPQDRKWMWLGWDYIYGNDIHGLISHCETIFNKNLG